MDEFKRKRSSLSFDKNESMEGDLGFGSNDATDDQETLTTAIFHDEQKFLVKLEQETGYLTDNNKFFPELVISLKLIKTPFYLNLLC